VKNIALFVEGKTETIFISEMIKQIFGEKKINIDIQDMQDNYNKISIEIYITDSRKEYYFLIYNCGSDEKVKSNIIENYQGLIREGFIYIIGLQDLFNPQRRKRGIDDKIFRENINNGIMQTIPARIFFAIQELEAWFIAEEKHYQKISPELTIEVVNSITGIDIRKDDTEVIDHPSKVLDKIYIAGGRRSGYSKKEYVVKDVVGMLDFSNLYLAVRYRNKSLNELLNCLDGLIP
jgi:hypothetical protein